MQIALGLPVTNATLWAVIAAAGGRWDLAAMLLAVRMLMAIGAGWFVIGSRDVLRLGWLVPKYFALFFALFQELLTEEAKRYLDKKPKWHAWPQTSSPAAIILNLELRSFGHQFVYDPATLSDSLAKTGFQAITQFHP